MMNSFSCRHFDNKNMINNTNLVHFLDPERTKANQTKDERTWYDDDERILPK